MSWMHKGRRWEHRVVRYTDENHVTLFAIVEVSYDAAGTPTYARTGVEHWGPEADDLREALVDMREAFDKPVLDVSAEDVPGLVRPLKQRATRLG